MTYQVGDPGHLSVHNALRAELDDAATRMGVEVVLPDEAVAGNTGHVDAHNLITTALDKIAAESSAPVATFRENSSTNGVFSVITEGDTMYELIRYDEGGLLTVTQDGYADVIVVAGGGGGAGNWYQYHHGGNGAGGPLYKGSLYFPAGDLVVTVGAGGAGGATGNIPKKDGNCGGTSEIENVITVRGNNVKATSTPLEGDTFTGNSSPDDYGVPCPGSTATVTTPGGGGGGASAGSGNTAGFTGTPGVVLIRTEWKA